MSRIQPSQLPLARFVHSYAWSSTALQDLRPRQLFRALIRGPDLCPLLLGPHTSVVVLARARLREQWASAVTKVLVRMQQTLRAIASPHANTPCRKRRIRYTLRVFQISCLNRAARACQHIEKITALMHRLDCLAAREHNVTGPNRSARRAAKQQAVLFASGYSVKKAGLAYAASV